MSIYASLPGIDDESPCGEPWLYRGSHTLPAKTDPRGGWVGLAAIPSHITRDGRDDRPEDGRPWPWLRLSVHALDDDPTVVLNPAQARELAAQLTGWADKAQPGPGQNTAETATGARESDEHPAARGQSRPEGENGPHTGAQDRAADVRRAVRIHLGRTDGPETDAIATAVTAIVNREHELARRAVDRVRQWATELDHPRHRGQPGIPAPVVAKQLRDLIQPRL